MDRTGAKLCALAHSRCSISFRLRSLSQHGSGAVITALAGHPGAAVAGAAAVLAMTAWLLIYRNVSAPVNRQLTAAAHDGRTPGDARALQRQWDHVINARAALQTAAVAALCAALILS
jgi:hypothetical protein